MEETRVALIGIMINDNAAATRLNAILHEYGDYVVGRMGIPYKSRGISVISLVLDAPPNIISALSGKLGMLPNVSTKTIYAKLPPSGENIEGKL